MSADQFVTNLNRYIKAVEANENLGPDPKNPGNVGSEWDMDYFESNIARYPGEEDSDETPVVAFHGNTGRADDWVEMYKGLRTKDFEAPLLARNTESTSPDTLEYADEFLDTIETVKQEYGVEEVDVLTHSLAGPVALYAIHENDLYDDIQKMVSMAGAFNGTNTADFGSQTGKMAFEPLSPEFVTRESAEDGELGRVREESRLTDEIDVYAAQAGEDIFFQPMEETLYQFNPYLRLHSEGTHMACEMFRQTWGIPENDPSSPVLEGAEENREFEDHRHKSLVEEGDEEVVGFVLKALEKE